MLIAVSVFRRQASFIMLMMDPEAFAILGFAGFYAHLADENDDAFGNGPVGRCNFSPSSTAST
jgi:hypothetical protein